MDNIIDLMPYLEGAKFGWTVDMTHAVLKQGVAVPVLEPRPPVNPYTGEVSALACLLNPPAVFPENMGDTTRPVT